MFAQFTVVKNVSSLCSSMFKSTVISINDHCSIFGHLHCLNLFDYRSPSVSRIRAKMLYATSKDRFRRELEGIHYEIQATDPTEMDLEVIRERAN